ncbi:MAG: monovalent cation/H(+) antiporter subunit G [Lachnospiraceae bacterium]|nr:monovalent cation/H(+) antiporter subunit G [Lachnospiraceae bacterium]
MTVLEWLRFLFGASMIAIGLFCFGISILGVFRFKYVMNRIHAAAVGDTLGLLSFTVGMMILNGFNLTSLKMLIVPLFLWFSSPASSHLVARMEITVDEEDEKHYRKINLIEDNKNACEEKQDVEQTDNQ